MTNKLIFLSHIHAERDLAALIQTAVVEEFSGMVDVFVSSDGSTIPAGANLLKRIEGGLSNCIAAIYLLSPASTPRPWINFELGAVWVRNAINEKNGGPEIPAIPLCHSGMKPSALPSPANNLSGIELNDAAQLETAFKSLQRAVGGRGSLRTNFDELAMKVRAYELKSTIGAAYREVASLTETKIPELIAAIKKVQPGQGFLLIGAVEQKNYSRLKDLEGGALKGKISVKSSESQMRTSERGAYWAENAEIRIANPAEFLQHIT